MIFFLFGFSLVYAIKMYDENLVLLTPSEKNSNLKRMQQCKNGSIRSGTGVLRKKSNFHGLIMILI